MDKPPLIQRIEKIEENLEKLKQAFIDHWKWHRGEEDHKQEVAKHFHERMGIKYAVARSRDDAYRGAFAYGPTSDLVKIRNDCLAENGYIMVMFEDIPGSAPESQIVMEYDEKWKDVVPPERLP